MLGWGILYYTIYIYIYIYIYINIYIYIFIYLFIYSPRFTCPEALRGSWAFCRWIPGG